MFSRTPAPVYRALVILVGLAIVHALHSSTFSRPNIYSVTKQTQRRPCSPSTQGEQICEESKSPDLRGPITESLANSIVDSLTSFNATIDNCPVFVTRYPASDDVPYTSWTPWQPPLTGDAMSSVKQLECQSEEFCDEMYPLDETEQIARLIYENQHPEDCSTARFLVLTKEWQGGLGSVVHVKARMLLAALATRRVLIDGSTSAWSMTNPNNCPEQNWACYFAPTTSCRLPQDWLATSEVFKLGGGNDTQYVHSPVTSMPGGVLPNSMNDLLSEFASGVVRSKKPHSWWVTQATVYLIRPNKRVINAVCFYWNCVMNHAFTPRPMASVFVRSGDKWKEAALHDAFEHLQLLETFSTLHESLRPKIVYFGTDDADVLLNSTKLYGDQWNMRWLGYHRDSRGLTGQEVARRYHSPMTEWQILVSLAELFISSSADIFVGTLSSNWCRLVDELRKVQGKARIHYLTPEERLIAGLRL